jgi:ABC-2 type transport system permease protein
VNEHQVIGANVQGATMLSGLAEYSSLKVLEHQYGKSKCEIPKTS